MCRNNKRYSVIATYAEPICSGNPGVITGQYQLVVMETTPIYGNKATSGNGPYASVPGINNAKDYTPGILSLLLTIEEQ
jgi:hypothetical protein